MVGRVLKALTAWGTECRGTYLLGSLLLLLLPMRPVGAAAAGTALLAYAFLRLKPVPWARVGPCANYLPILGAAYLIAATAGEPLIAVTAYIAVSIISYAGRHREQLVVVATLSALAYAVSTAAASVPYAALLLSEGAGTAYAMAKVHAVALFTLLAYAPLTLAPFRDTKVGSYLSDTPEAIPILMFMIMLSAAAVTLAIGDEARANVYAEVAYYALVVGVAISLYSAIKESDKGEAGDHGNEPEEPQAHDHDNHGQSKSGIKPGYTIGGEDR